MLHVIICNRIYWYKIWYSDMSREIPLPRIFIYIHEFIWGWEAFWRKQKYGLTGVPDPIPPWAFPHTNKEFSQHQQSVQEFNSIPTLPRDSSDLTG